MGQITSDDKLTLLGEEYERGRALGRGAYGKVSAIQHKASEKWKVIKEIHKSILLEKQELEIAVIERKILSHLQGCCFVPRLFASFQNDQLLQLLLEFCQGGELEYHLDTKGFFLEDEVRHIMAHLTLGLEEMHAAGVMHRDLKLSNILLDNNGFTFINDFGLALLCDTSKKRMEVSTPSKNFLHKKIHPELSGKIIPELGEKTSEIQNSIISSHVTDPPPPDSPKPPSLVYDPNPHKLVIGTIPYIPPELLLGEAHDEMVDWWSLGIIGYELTHGVPPWPISGKSEDKNVYQLLYDSIMEHKLNFAEHLSKLFKELVEGLLHIDPTKRFGPHEVKSHPFFKNFNWELVRQKKIKPPFRPNPDKTHFSLTAAIEDDLEINQPKHYTPTEKDNKLFREWDWINPKFPLGLTPEEEDIVLLKTVQHYDNGLELYQKEGLRPRGRIVFHLKDLPEGGLFYTSRGTPVEKSRGTVLVGDVRIPLV